MTARMLRRPRVRTDDFDYDLPTGLIAQHPAEPRDAAGCWCSTGASGQIDHRVFSRPRRLPARRATCSSSTRPACCPRGSSASKDETGGAAEVLLLRERYDDAWECLVKPGRRLKPGAKIVFGDGLLTGLVVEQLDESGGRLVQFTPHGTIVPRRRASPRRDAAAALHHRAARGPRAVPDGLRARRAHRRRAHGRPALHRRAARQDRATRASHRDRSSSTSASTPSGR